MDPTTPTRRFGSIAGTVLVALGILGFTVTGSSAVSGSGYLFALEVNPLHNLLHLLVGGSLLVGVTRSADAAHTLALVTGVSLGTLSLIGLTVRDPATPLALNTADDLLHLMTALAGVGTWVADRRTKAIGTAR